MKNISSLCSVVLVLWCLPACQSETGGKKADSKTISFASRVTEAHLEEDNWLLHGRTYDEQRFSPLSQINTKNVSNLSLEWFLDLPEARGQESTPLIIDGVLYASAAY